MMAYSPVYNSEGMGAEILRFEMKLTTKELYELRDALNYAFEGTTAEAHVYFADGSTPTNRPIAWARDVHGVERELHVIVFNQ